MLVMIDTEFTDFTNMELISIGLVTADNSKTFYMENSQYDKQLCSGFVNNVVVPLLSRDLIVTRPKLKIEEMLREWFGSIDDDVDIVLDYTGDWYLMLDLLNNKLPSNVNSQPVFVNTLVSFTPEGFAAYQQGFEEYFCIFPDQRQHHALCDAKANLYGYHKAMKLLY